ncbi:MAG: hypothetical protein ACE148_00465 [Vicinamibacterales bacterium]
MHAREVLKHSRLESADLASLAREFSPRVETCHPRLVVVDVGGLDRLIGPPQTIGEEMRRAASERTLAVHVALASTQVAAAMIARQRAGVTVVPPGREAAVLAPLPLRSLIELAELVQAGESASTGRARAAAAFPIVPRVVDAGRMLAVFDRWGLKTLGDLAALPPAGLSERLGQDALAWQKVARGEDYRPLSTDFPEQVFEESLELEWPIEGLEPLSFVLGRLLEALAAKLERADRGAAVMRLELRLVTRETFTRSLELPAAIRDPRVLRTIALLDLESHPVPAGIDAVTVSADVVAGRILQYSLIRRPLPSPERVSTLVARLTALVGESRAGSPAIVDSYRPGAFTMTTFAPQETVAGTRQNAPRDASASVYSVLPPSPGRLSGLRRTSSPQSSVLDGRLDHHSPPPVLRRFRIPVPASVAVKEGRPDRVATDRPGLGGGEVRTAAGPWRTSGEWWNVKDARLQVRAGAPRPQVGWNRDEWDVWLSDGGVYRVYFDRDHGRWFMDGILD